MIIAVGWITTPGGQVALWPHNPEVTGSNPVPTTMASRSIWSPPTTEPVPTGPTAIPNAMNTTITGWCNRLAKGQASAARPIVAANS